MNIVFVINIYKDANDWVHSEEIKNNPRSKIFIYYIYKMEESLIQFLIIKKNFLLYRV